jgi:hypothetical protein
MEFPDTTSAQVEHGSRRVQAPAAAKAPLLLLGKTGRARAAENVDQGLALFHFSAYRNHY